MTKRFILSLIGALFGTILFAGTAHAGPVVGFNAGKIIEDNVFTNAASMNAAQIQTFLNSKVPVCDTNGTQYYAGMTRAAYAASKGVSTPFICLKDYSENGKSAAQIIYDAAQNYQINPQVLIVLLQKEQGLVTDDWPFPTQYRAATGYGCPDTASSCNTAYYGLTNQINHAAQMFHAIMVNSPTWYTPYLLGNNYIQYNPDASCGGSTVNIENRATQALYNYTPYQPNQAALNAGYGTAPPCGTYGNRNFYLYFNEWFGGFLISTADNGNLYVRGNNATYYRIHDYAQYQALGLGGLRVYQTTSSYLSNLTSKGNLTSVMTFGDNGNVFSIDSGSRHYVSYAAFLAYGSPTVSTLAAGLDALIPEGADMSTVITQHNVGVLYAVSGGKKRYISNASYNSDGYANTYVSWMSGYFLDGLPLGPPILPAATILHTTDTNQYSILSTDRTSKQLISPALIASISLGGTYSDVSSVIDQIPTSTDPAAGILSRDTTGNLYILDGTKKIHLTASQLSSINKMAADFTTVDSTFLSRFTTVDYTTPQLLTWVGSDGRVYQLDNGELVHIQSLDDFNRLSYSFNQVAQLSQNTANNLFTNHGRSLLLPGTFFNVDGGVRVYVQDSNSAIRAVTTADLYNTDLGKSWGAVRTISQSTFDYYPKAADLTNIVTTSDGTHWLVSLGIKHKLSDMLLADYDYAGALNAPVDTRTLGSTKQGIDATHFIRIGSDARVYYIDNGKKDPLGSVDAFHAAGGTDWSQVVSVSAGTAALFQTGTMM